MKKSTRMTDNFSDSKDTKYRSNFLEQSLQSNKITHSKKERQMRIEELVGILDRHSLIDIDA
jgi:hypothetical protein